MITRLLNWILRLSITSDALTPSSIYKSCFDLCLCAICPVALSPWERDAIERRGLLLLELFDGTGRAYWKF